MHCYIFLILMLLNQGQSGTQYSFKIIQVIHLNLEQRGLDTEWCICIYCQCQYTWELVCAQCINARSCYAVKDHRGRTDNTTLGLLMQR